MKQDNTRHITVKVLVNADEFIEFDRACNGEPHSRVLRDLATHWSRWMNRSQGSRRREWPRAGHNMAMSFPSRRGGAPMPLRL